MVNICIGDYFVISEGVLELYYLSNKFWRFLIIVCGYI